MLEGGCHKAVADDYTVVPATCWGTYTTYVTSAPLYCPSEYLSGCIAASRFSPLQYGGDTTSCISMQAQPSLFRRYNFRSYSLLWKHTLPWAAP